MSAWPDWDAAFRALVQDDDGKPLAALLRSGRPMPSAAARALADLFDPQFPWSPFNWSPPPPDQIQTFNDSKLKVEVAWKALKAECARLAEIYNKRVKEPCNKLEWWDMFELEACAEELEDQKALRAFIAHRKARDEHTAVKDALNPAVLVRLAVQLSKEDWVRRVRNERVAGEMLIRKDKGQLVSDAAEAIGAKLDPPLKERQITAIWSEMKEANPFLKLAPKRKRQRRRT